MQEQTHNVSREMGILSKTQKQMLEIINTVTEMRMLLMGLFFDWT